MFFRFTDIPGRFSKNQVEMMAISDDLKYVRISLNQHAIKQDDIVAPVEAFGDVSKFKNFNLPFPYYAA